MTKFFTFLTGLLLLTTVLNAQSTYTLNETTNLWNGADLAHFTLTSGTGDAPITYIIPDGLSLSTGLNVVMAFPCNPTFIVHGSFVYRGDTNCSIDIVADGSSDGEALVSLIFTASMQDLNLSFVDVATNAGLVYGTVTGDLTLSTDAATSFSKTNNLIISGNATYNLAGSGIFTHNKAIGGKLTANVSAGQLRSTQTVGSFQGNVSGGLLDLKGTVTSSANFNISGTGKAKTSAIFNSKFISFIGETGELDVDAATFNSKTAINNLGNSKVRLNAGTKFNNTLGLDIDPNAKLAVNGIVDVTGMTTAMIKGTKTINGEFKMADATSTLELTAGAKLELPAPTSKLQMGTVTKSGIITYDGPLVITVGALPIELLSFTAKNNRDNVQIDWMTATEQNVDRYEILRSSTGQNYKVIHSIYDIEDSEVVKNYSFEDVDFPEGRALYYQLRTVDLDGTFEFSDVEVVLMNTLEPEITLAPNPAYEHLIIEAEAKGEVEIYNSTGQKIYETKVIQGKNSIDLNQFSGGVYVVRFIGVNDFVRTKRLVIQNK